MSSAPRHETWLVEDNNDDVSDGWLSDLHCNLFRPPSWSIWLTLSLVSRSILISAEENWRLTYIPPWWGHRHFMCVFTHGGLQVAIQKVLHGGSSSGPDFREQVYFLIRRVMQTALALMPGVSSARHALAAWKFWWNKVTTGSQPFHFWQEQNLNSDPYC